MARAAVIQSFYASSIYQKFRSNIILERCVPVDVDGVLVSGLICERCNKLLASKGDVTLHHTCELTVHNVSDAMISLNPDKVELICRDCHDIEHERFGRSKGKQVFIVYGPPCSGKGDYVYQNKKRNDLIVCLDSLFEAITGLPRYDKPDNMLSNVRGVYNLLIDQVKTRYGRWQTAWIVGGFADKYKREKLADDLGAELVYCECNEDDARSRILNDDRRRNMEIEYNKYIDDWFNKYRE
ncbi:HNH endonuclease family protein [Pelosinus propionicus]|uniref:HNH endonuclease n=1 Tax=Pelosinus propionicus DSM 13327 TaxID=1123291 RepID=A0A1I4N155_9FIRM|nr:hypothetical protein [Pelosinus propionicus]SFM09324.1 hypothetical protein SAMN04490355_104032 [Pelosinus propionicus DSM 13327]